MPASVDAVLAVAKEHGFTLCNFFQIEDGTFRGNFIADGKGRAFGQHALPGIALAQALERAIEATEDEDLIG